MFEVTEPHFCPSCPPVLNKSQRRIDMPLNLLHKNASGSGSDIATCPTCGKGFTISYKVDKIKPNPAYNIDLVAQEQKKLEEQRRAKQAALKMAQNMLLSQGMTLPLCLVCGNKRCPKAEDNKFKCTNSNEDGQIGELE